jgi:hypothetical protein
VKRTLTVLLAVLALAACGKSTGTGPGGGGSGGTSSALDSGIRGQVLVGPMCPVQRAGSPCPDRPIAALVEVLDGQGNVVASTHSGDDGRFEVEVEPGSYTVRPTPGGTTGFPTGRDTQVVVPPHQVVEVTLSMDSGIR